MEAVILAGGKGRRLLPHTAEIPKPLVPLGDRTVLDILLGQCRRAGVTKVHLAVNHLAHLIEAAIGNGNGIGLDVVYHREELPLSTVAPLRRIPDLPEHFLVANGDVLTDLNFRRLFDAHVAGSSLATVATYHREELIDFGVIDTDEAGRMVGFHEKPSYGFDVSMGVYVFSRDVLRLVPEKGPFGFDQLMLTMLEQNETINTYRHKGYWLDIGRPDDYERACRDIENLDL